MFHVIDEEFAASINNVLVDGADTLDLVGQKRGLILGQAAMVPGVVDRGEQKRTAEGRRVLRYGLEAVEDSGQTTRRPRCQESILLPVILVLVVGYAERFGGLVVFAAARGQFVYQSTSVRICLQYRKSCLLLNGIFIAMVSKGFTGSALMTLQANRPCEFVATTCPLDIAADIAAGVA